MPEQPVVLETDPATARELGRGHFTIYLTLPNYLNNLRRLGFTDDDFADGGSDRLVDGIVAWGDEAAIARRVQEHFDAGADHVCIQVVTPRGLPGAPASSSGARSRRRWSAERLLHQHEVEARQRSAADLVVAELPVHRDRGLLPRGRVEMHRARSELSRALLEPHHDGLAETLSLMVRVDPDALHLDARLVEGTERTHRDDDTRRAHPRGSRPGR